MRYYTVQWLHIPTKTRGTNQWLCESEQAFHALMNKCNASAPGIWTYWT